MLHFTYIILPLLQLKFFTILVQSHTHQVKIMGTNSVTKSGFDSLEVLINNTLGMEQ